MFWILTDVIDKDDFANKQCILHSQDIWDAISDIYWIHIKQTYSHLIGNQIKYNATVFDNQSEDPRMFSSRHKDKDSDSRFKLRNYPAVKWPLSIKEMYWPHDVLLFANRNAAAYPNRRNQRSLRQLLRAVRTTVFSIPYLSIQLTNKKGGRPIQSAAPLSLKTWEINGLQPHTPSVGRFGPLSRANQRTQSFCLSVSERVAPSAPR